MTEAPNTKEEISHEIRRELELMEADDATKALAIEKGKKIKLLNEDKKLENLLATAKSHGVLAAIKTAQSMNEPYLLDSLHDLLAKEGLYKQFTK